MDGFCLQVTPGWEFPLLIQLLSPSSGFLFLLAGVSYANVLLAVVLVWTSSSEDSVSSSSG